MNTFQNNPFYKAPSAPVKKKNIIVNIIQAIAILAILLLIAWFTILGQNQVDGPSMRASFYTGDFLLLNRFPALFGDSLSKTLGIDYQRGDVVVLQKPGLKEFVKRIIGLPGDKISIDKGRVFINGQVLVEDYLPDLLFTNGGDFIAEGGPVVEIPEGNYIAIGDNRPESNDSRFSEIGFIKRQWIIGKVFVRIWPSDSIGFIPQGTYHFEDPNTYDFSKADPNYRHPSLHQQNYCADFIRQCYYAN